MSAMGGKRALATDIATDLADDYSHLDADLPQVRRCFRRDDADGRLPVLLRLQALWRRPAASRGPLLRVLFLRRRALPAYPGGAGERNTRLLFPILVSAMGRRRT